MGEFSEDTRHSVWKNSEVDNDTKLLLICDSYTNSYIIEDFAESFSEVWLVWGGYITETEKLVEMYSPDMVVFECAERVDRSSLVVQTASELVSK